MALGDIGPVQAGRGAAGRIHSGLVHAAHVARGARHRRRTDRKGVIEVGAVARRAGTRGEDVWRLGSNVLLLNGRAARERHLPAQDLGGRDVAPVSEGPGEVGAQPQIDVDTVRLQRVGVEVTRCHDRRPRRRIRELRVGIVKRDHVSRGRLTGEVLAESGSGVGRHDYVGFLDHVVVGGHVGEPHGLEHDAEGAAFRLLRLDRRVRGILQSQGVGIGVGVVVVQRCPRRCLGLRCEGDVTQRLTRAVLGKGGRSEAARVRRTQRELPEGRPLYADLRSRRVAEVAVMVKAAGNVHFQMPDDRQSQLGVPGEDCARTDGL